MKPVAAIDFATAPHKANCALARAGSADPARRVPPQGVVFHSPGTTWATRIRQQCATPRDALAVDVAAARAFDLRPYHPGYLIGTTGRIFQLAQDTARTSHAGRLAREAPIPAMYATTEWSKWASPSDGSGYRLHGRDPAAVYDWWYSAFPDHHTPLTVFPWSASPNDAVGVDLMPNVSGSGPMFSPEQFASAVWLVQQLAVVHGFPITDRRVTTHSLASPVERGCVRREGKIYGTPWDLSPKDFRLDALLARAIVAW